MRIINVAFTDFYARFTMSEKLGNFISFATDFNSIFPAK